MPPGDILEIKQNITASVLIFIFLLIKAINMIISYYFVFYCNLKPSKFGNEVKIKERKFRNIDFDCS